jgi:hypothetical protein
MMSRFFHKIVIFPITNAPGECRIAVIVKRSIVVVEGNHVLFLCQYSNFNIGFMKFNTIIVVCVEDGLNEILGQGNNKFFFFHNKQTLLLYLLVMFIMYSQTCIKRSPLGQRKCGLLRQVTS